jgi:hypothetical protein
MKRSFSGNWLQAKYSGGLPFRSLDGLKKQKEIEIYNPIILLLLAGLIY